MEKNKESDKFLQQFSYDMIKAKTLEDEKNKKILIKIPLNVNSNPSKSGVGVPDGKK